MRRDERPTLTHCSLTVLLVWFEWLSGTPYFLSRQ